MKKKKKKIILKNPVTVKKENHLLLKNKKEMFTLKEENFFFDSDGALRGRSLKAFAVSVAAAIAGQCHSAVVFDFDEAARRSQLKGFVSGCRVFVRCRVFPFFLKNCFRLLTSGFQLGIQASYGMV